MPYDAEILKNAMKLKKCRKIYTTVFYTYLVGGIFLILYSFLNMTGLAWDWLFIALGTGAFYPIVFATIIDSLAVAPAAFFLAFRGSYRQHDLCAVAALVLVSANLVLMIILKLKHFFDFVPISFYAIAIYSVVCIAVSVMNIRANIIYHQLEEEQGFPHFNERFMEQEEERFQRGILDKYEMQMQQRMKTATDKMDELGCSDKTLEKNDDSHTPSIMDKV